MNTNSNNKYVWDGVDRRNIMPARKTPAVIFAISVVVMAAIFTADIMAPLGVAGGVPYVILVLLGWWYEERAAVYYLALISTILTILGYVLSSDGAISWMIITNRLYALAAIWATAVVLWWAWRERALQTHKLLNQDDPAEKKTLLLGREIQAVTLLVIVVAASAFAVLLRVEDGARSDVEKNLKATLATTHASIQNQEDAVKNTARVWAGNPQVKLDIAALLDMPLTVTGLAYSKAQFDLRVLIKSLFSTVGYRGFFVIGENNINLASSRNNNIGVVNLLAGQGDFLDRVWAGETLVSLPQESDVPLFDYTGELIEGLATMFVATPVKSVSGRVIAILAFRLDPDESFSPFLARGRFGESGESYVFDSTGLMISESRFNVELHSIGLIEKAKHSDLNIHIRNPGGNILLGYKPSLPPQKRPLTIMAESATAGQNGVNLDGYHDYRGVSVVGAWLWDEELGFGIATEIDTEEAYATYNNIRFIIFIFSGLSIGVLVVVALISSKARNRIVQSEKKYRNVINSTAEGYCKVNAEGQLLEVNTAFCDMLGCKPEELLGKRPYEFASGENRVHFEQKLSEMTTTPQCQCDIIFDAKQGKEVHTHVSATSVNDRQGKFVGAFAFFTDITEHKQADAAIRDSEKRFRAMVENSGDAIYIHDRYGKIFDVNQFACDQLGYSRDELFKLSIAQLDVAVDFENLRETWDLGEADPAEFPMTLETAHRRKDGTTFPIEVRVSLLPTDIGTRFVAMVRDITARKQAEKHVRESEQLLSAAINNISDGFVLCDADGRILLFNKRFKDLYPNSRDFVQKGILFEDFVRAGAERDEYPDATDRIEEWLAERKEKGRKKGGSFDQQLVGDRWAQISIGRLPDGGWVGIHVDVTSIKEAMDTADKANLAKSEFLSSMSHELRTPLNAILGFAQMLDYNPKEPLSDLQKESVEHIMKGGQHLLELINDILDLAKIEAGKIELSLESISPMNVLEDCINLISSMARDQGIEISVPDATTQVPKVLADHTRFKQVLLNFMSNAVKYNRVNGTVFINFEEVPGDMLRIYVTDTGMGISHEKQQELFKPFSRLGAENSDIEGTGIGLVVCKDLIDLMNGAVGVESEVGKGSSFWFDLPLAVDSDEAGAAMQKNLEAQDNEQLLGADGTMLYVEDNPDNLKLMELIVSRMDGLVMISTHTGELGVEMARAERPDLIILDINLPGMNGIETLKKLQSHDSTKNIPVLALSAAATKRDIERGMEAGFLRYLTKPILVPEVIEAIKMALEKN